MKTNIIIASDHNGVQIKKSLKDFLKLQGFNVIDLGPHINESVDYTDYASQLSNIITNKEADKGILICGTGVGMSIVANRHENVRAVLAHNIETAVKSREHNNSNVICLGAWINSEENNKQILSAWLSENWAEGRHVKRVEKIDLHKGIVLTNGVFDVLHKGHIELLKFSKSQGDHLVVAIDSDKRVKELKGKDRPINSQVDRKRVLEAIEYVDEVVVFNTTEELKDLYLNLKPNVLVKGSEWSADEIRKRDNIPNNIDIKVYPLVGEYSTTNILKKIKSISTCEKV